MDGDPSNQQHQQPNPAYDAWSNMANEASGEQTSKDSENSTRIDDAIQRDTAADIGTKAINFNPAEVPSGIRDEQDYREYQAEREAKLNEAKAFFNQNFRGGDFVDNQELDAFLNSPELKTVTDAGFSMQDLRAAGLISTPDQKPRINFSDYLEDIRGYMWNCSAGDLFGGYLGARDVVEGIASLFSDGRWHETVRDDVRAAQKTFKTVLEKRKNGENLANDDYISIFEKSPQFHYLEERIVYGNPFDPKDRVEKTINALTEYQGGDNEQMTWFHTDVARRIDNGDFDNSDRTIAAALAIACQKNADRHINDMQESSSQGFIKEAEDTQALLMRTLNDNQICKYHDVLTESGVFEDDILSTMYCSGAPYGKPFAKHLYPSHDLCRHAERLKRDGFSDDSIVYTIHEHNVQLDLEEIKAMQNAGFNDADIIYAGRLYEKGDLRGDGELMVSDYRPLESHEESVHFEPVDVITALQRELKNRD